MERKVNVLSSPSSHTRASYPEKAGGTGHAAEASEHAAVSCCSIHLMHLQTSGLWLVFYLSFWSSLVVTTALSCINCFQHPEVDLFLRHPESITNTGAWLHGQLWNVVRGWRHWGMRRTLSLQGTVSFQFAAVRLLHVGAVTSVLHHQLLLYKLSAQL